MDQVFQKIKTKAGLSREDVVKLLSIKNTGADYYQLLYQARVQSEEAFGNRGYVFAQIGINAEPCSVNCNFCSMAAKHYALPGRWRKSADEIVDGVRQLVADRANDIFLMTTASTTPELCKIAAVAQLVVRPARSMNVHEVTEMSILAGVNQLYAEAGANPRDTDDNTENNRGYTVSATRKLLENSGYIV